MARTQLNPNLLCSVLAFLAELRAIVLPCVEHRHRSAPAHGPRPQESIRTTAAARLSARPTRCDGTNLRHPFRTMAQPEAEFAGDKIGRWTEIKLEIIRNYASAYSHVLSTRKNPSFQHVYVDGFAGAGLNLSKAT